MSGEIARALTIDSDVPSDVLLGDLVVMTAALKYIEDAYTYITNGVISFTINAKTKHLR